jgi:hypothetical protein
MDEHPIGSTLAHTPFPRGCCAQDTTAFDPKSGADDPLYSEIEN